MSTKSTLAHGDTFHFYNEALDDDHVYLEVREVQFEAGYGRVMIPIPMHIWETIRHLGAAELDLVDKTDSELLAMVEAEVDRRIEEFRPPSLMILSGLDFSVFSAHCLMGLRTCHAKSRSSRDWNTIRASDDVNGGSMRQSWRCAHLKCVA